MTIGERIQLRMEESGMSRQYVCYYANITESALCRYIHDEREPRIETLERIATALKVSPAWLAFGIDPEVQLYEDILLP